MRKAEAEEEEEMYRYQALASPPPLIEIARKGDVIAFVSCFPTIE